nr:hypothetical protein CFP56_53186 [Quercus suber]
MDKKRGSMEYFEGVSQFVAFASPSARNGKMLCPCVKCVNLILQPVNVVRDHCWASGMLNNYKFWKFHGESAVATTAPECGSSQVQESENVYGDFHGMLHDLCLPHEMPPEPMEEAPPTEHLGEGMGKKRRLPLIDVGAGPSRSQQRGEENLEAAHTTPHARADAPDAGMQRDFPLTVLEVGDGSSRSRDRVEEELRAAFAADHALGDASDDDETQPPSQDTAGIRRDFPLTVLEVGDGSSRSRDRVQKELRAAFAADHAQGDASDDDET